MKSGLEGRNNSIPDLLLTEESGVSMKSGLEGRNNGPSLATTPSTPTSQ